MCCRNVQELMEVMGHYHRLISGSFRIEAHPHDSVKLAQIHGLV